MVLRKRQRNKKENGFDNTGDRTALNVITNTTNKEFQRIFLDSEKARSNEWHNQFLENNDYIISSIKKEKSNYSVNDEENKNESSELNHYDDNIFAEAREEEDACKIMHEDSKYESKIDEAVFNISFEQQILENNGINASEEGFEIIDMREKVTINREKEKFQTNYQIQGSTSSVCSDFSWSLGRNRSLFDGDDSGDEEVGDYYDEDEAFDQYNKNDKKEVGKTVRKVKLFQSLPLREEYDSLFLDGVNIEPRKGYDNAWKMLQEEKRNGYSGDVVTSGRLGIPLYNNVKPPSIFPSIIEINQNHFPFSVASTDNSSSEYPLYYFCCI